jgi:tetratricopeptide (TPR) repeat protein
VAEEESAKNEGKALEPAANDEPQAVDPRTIRDRNRRIRAEAAEKRRKQREGTPERRRGAPARNLDASEIMDDALARSSHAAWEWLKRNSNRVQWVVVLLVVGGIGWKIYSYRQTRNIAAASETLVQAINAERGRTGADPGKVPDPYTGLIDDRPTFPNEEGRLKTAEREYREAAGALKGPGAGLAQLGLAGVLYDQGKYADAKKAYESARDSELSSVDRDARGRAIEGIGLSLEALGQFEPAVAAYKQLENSEIPGFAVLALFHQGRVLYTQGQRDKAKELLKKALDKIAKTEDKDKRAAGRPGYVEQQVRELLGSIDPSAVPAPPSQFSAKDLEALQKTLGESGGKLDPKQLEKFLKDMGANPGALKPSAPPVAPPASEPAAPTPEPAAPEPAAPEPAAPEPASSAP